MLIRPHDRLRQTIDRLTYHPRFHFGLVLAGVGLIALVLLMAGTVLAEPSVLAAVGAASSTWWAPILDAAIPVAASAVAAFLVWIAHRWFGLQLDEAARHRIQSAVWRATAHGLSRVDVATPGHLVHQTAVAAATEYLRQTVPDSLSRLRLDERALATLVGAAIDVEDQIAAARIAPPPESGPGTGGAS